MNSGLPVNVSGNSVLSGGDIIYVGYSKAGSSGELDISGNAVVSNKSTYGIYVEICGDISHESVVKRRFERYRAE